MTNEEIVMKIAELVIQLLEQNKPAESKAASDKVEMLTIGEAVREFPGLTKSTLRQLTAQEKIRFFRAGEGNNGKILINKASLVDYLNGETKEDSNGIGKKKK
ncbi:MAG: helix-turn-helix domain-containing protein [Ruminococcus sp.]|nr:helix-turn-helix domain-containing protein [Ruminococcus sp.]